VPTFPIFSLHACAECPRESGLEGPQRNSKRTGGWKEVFLELSGLRALGDREFPDALVELLRDLQVSGSGTADDLRAQQAGR
jgi:hypothetical protein